MSAARAALEAHLAARPADAAAHAAYADFLIEAGDPRGDYIRLQLALEDRSQPTDRRAEMVAAADELMRRHEAEWLGPFAEWMNLSRSQDPNRQFVHRVQIEWRRGWIDAVSFESDCGDEMYKAAAASPAFQLVRSVKLTGGTEAMTPYDFRDIVPILGVWPLTRLGVINGYNTSESDGLVDVLIASGIIDRLSILDVSNNFITDDGAVALAYCPAVKRLQQLIAYANYITPIGLAALAEIGHKDLGGCQRTLRGGFLA